MSQVLRSIFFFNVDKHNSTGQIQENHLSHNVVLFFILCHASLNIGFLSQEQIVPRLDLRKLNLLVILAHQFEKQFVVYRLPTKASKIK